MLFEERDPVTNPTNGPRIGFCLWHTLVDHPFSLRFVSQSLLREWSRICPERIIVFYNTHRKELLREVEVLDKVRGLGLRKLEHIFRYQREFDVLYHPIWWGQTSFLDRPQVHLIPEVFSPLYRHFYGKRELEHLFVLSNYSFQCSTYIVTPSNYSKRTLVEKCDLPPGMIRVAPHSVHPVFFDESNPGTRPATMPLDTESYLFYPAIPTKRKNHETLLDVLHLLQTRYGIKPKCLFAGPIPDEPGFVDVLGEIRKRNLQESVHHVGIVSLSELKYLYLNARALVWPSFSEGFGIPLLEAMTVGCPIIASNRASIPEVAGDAALYFNPDDSADMAEAIYGFYERPEQAHEMVSRGKERSKDFSDARQAEETLDVLEDACVAWREDVTNRMAIVKDPDRKSPLLTIILFCKSLSSSRIVPEIEKLLEQFGRAVEVIYITPWLHSGRITQLSNQAKLIPKRSDFHTTVESATKEASGTFVFFSGGNVAPLSSFILYLADEAYSGRVTEELLCGDTYFINRRLNRVQSTRSYSEMELEFEKEYCCNHLAFVVRKEPLYETIRLTKSKIRGLSDLAALLFDTCHKRRLFRTICRTIVHLRPGGRPYSEILLMKMKNELKYGKAMSLLLDKLALKNLALCLFDCYLNSPRWARAAVRSIVKPFWSSGS
jgi:alpha-1,3-rhamnosyl/mannosyltransferase